MMCVNELKELEKRLERITDELDKLMTYRNEVEEDLESFCENCEHRFDVCETLEYWGAKCQRCENTCPAEFDPEWSDCPKNKVYEELQEIVEDLEDEINETTRVQEKISEQIYEVKNKEGGKIC